MIDFDPIGEAVNNYYFNKDNEPIYIHSENFDTDQIEPKYFLRRYSEMPKLEQLALKKAKGETLDIGACAGCHSLYLQQKGINVTALERSKKCIEILKDRQIKNIISEDIFKFSGKQFDTILLLMNGTGIAGTIKNFGVFLSKLKSLLKPKGQIIIDSSDLIFLYENEDGSADINIAGNYYGELMYQTEYKGRKGNPFPWLYLDSELLTHFIESEGLKIESINRGEHYDYLAVIKQKQ